MESTRVAARLLPTESMRTLFCLAKTTIRQSAVKASPYGESFFGAGGVPEGHLDPEREAGGAPRGASPSRRRSRTAGTDSTTIVCHLTVDRSTGNAAVQERDAAIWFSARRRETSTAATIAEIAAQNRSCRWNHARVDIAAARWACTYDRGYRHGRARL